MTTRVTLDDQEEALERKADELLCRAEQDPERPVYTERQLARRGEEHLVRGRSIDARGPGDLDARDELRFLIAISRMEPFAKTCMRLWIDGWTQKEMAQSMRLSQAEISRQLRLAMRVCYETAPISFREFSKHTIYRKPAHARSPRNARRCRYCREAFLMHTGVGRFCSSSCQQAAISSSK